jgi:hypothetical protein
MNDTEQIDLMQVDVHATKDSSVLGAMWREMNERYGGGSYYPVSESLTTRS